MGTLFYILGLIGGELHGHTMQFSLFLILISGSVLVISRIRKNKHIGLYLFFTLLGIGSMLLNPVLKEERFFMANNGQDLSLQGKVVEVREYDYGNQYIIKPSKDNFFKSKIKVEAPKDLRVPKEGDIIRARGKIEALSFPRNPGSFNERHYLMTRGIPAKLKADSLDMLKEQKKLPVLQRIGHYYGGMFEHIMPYQEAQIMKAMLLGDKIFLSKDIQELYKDVGIAHVLAISGLHISVIAGLLWWILKKLGLSQRQQSIGVILVLWTYAALTGFSVSITRAATMMSVIILGTLIEEKPDPLTSWSFAALVLLLCNNLYLWDIGFQLSFVAVGSLIILTPFLGKIFIIPKKIRAYLAPALAVTLGTAPLIAYYYYVITPISILMNLILIPLISLVVIAGFLAMLICPISLLLAKLMIGSSYYLLVFIEKICQLGLKVPFATIIVGRPDPLELIIYILLLGISIFYLNLHLEERQKLKLYLGSLGILLGLFVFVKRAMPGNLQVIFLDVGQGDSMVIITPNHKTFVIDGGIKGNGKKLHDFLKYKGIRKVDGAILSHAHSDHMDGLGELAQTYPIERLFLSEIPLEDKHFKAFYDIIQKEDIPVYKMRANDLIKDKDMTIECIFPFEDLPPLEGNDASLVLVLKHGLVSYYFTGDIEKNFEEEVAAHIKSNQINILKVPHHGSKTSSTQALIDRSKPDLAVISCGEKNLYNHPSKEVIERYENNKVPIKITKDLGAIMTYSNKKKVKINSMEDKRMLWMR